MGDRLIARALEHSAGSLRAELERLLPSGPLLATETGHAAWWPDVGPTCEVLLADPVLGALSAAERARLAAAVRAAQGADGAWYDLAGRPDLGLTVLGWWALRLQGDDPAAPAMVRAVRQVHALGGAQRAPIHVRLWLAMAGVVPWSWLPAVPAEVWLLPPTAPLSPARVAPWARGMLTPYVVLAAAPAFLHLPDAKPLLLAHHGERRSAHVRPRLTRPGLAGDLLQALDRAAKLARKLPRAGLHRAALQQVQRELVGAQQPHGGWFSLRPTLLSLLALRVLGARSDDPRVRRGLQWMRAARAERTFGDEGARGEDVPVLQGLHAAPTTVVAGLVRALDDLPLVAQRAAGALAAAAITTGGPWQARAEAAPGGWAMELGGAAHVDVRATIDVLDAITGAASTSASAAGELRGGQRRAVDVVLAMQERDGSFARFERGEADVPLQRLPWADAELLADAPASVDARVARTADAVRVLVRCGVPASDDRIARALAWLERACAARERELAVGTVAAVVRCTCAVTPAATALRKRCERALRRRQRDDGSFAPVRTAASDAARESVVTATAAGLHALVSADVACVQTRRAAAALARLLAGADAGAGPATVVGLGVSPLQHDPGADARLGRSALRAFLAAGGRIEP